MTTDTQAMGVDDAHLIEILSRHADPRVRELAARFSDTQAHEAALQKADEEGYNRGWCECAKEMARRLKYHTEDLQKLQETMADEGEEEA